MRGQEDASIDDPFLNDTHRISEVVNRGNESVESQSLRQDDIEAPEQWFTQTLDHFNPLDNRTWQQVIIDRVAYR